MYETAHATITKKRLLQTKRFTDFLIDPKKLLEIYPKHNKIC